MTAPDLFGAERPVEPTLEERPVLGTPEQWAHCRGCLHLDDGTCPTPELCPAIVQTPSQLADMAPDQIALLDLDELTEAAPDADIRRALEEQGLTPAARKKVFEAATIKQTVLYHALVEYRTFQARLALVREAFGVSSNTEAIEHLLTFWEAHRATPHP